MTATQRSTYELVSVRADHGVSNPSKNGDFQEMFASPGYGLEESAEGVFVIGTDAAVLIPWSKVKHARYRKRVAEQAAAGKARESRAQAPAGG